MYDLIDALRDDWEEQRVVTILYSSIVVVLVLYVIGGLALSGVRGGVPVSLDDPTLVVIIEVGIVALALVFISIGRDLKTILGALFMTISFLSSIVLFGISDVITYCLFIPIILFFIGIAGFLSL